MNKVIIIGRLTTDPIIKTSNKTNNRFALLTIASQDNVNKDVTNFFDCSCFVANKINYIEYFKKGDMVYVDGGLSFNSYVNQSGQKVKSLKINIIDLQKLSSSAKNSDSSTIKSDDNIKDEKDSREEFEESSGAVEID